MKSVKTIITIMGMLAMFVTVSAAVEVTITADADGFPDGWDISNAFAGMTLSSFGTGRYSTDGLVYARTASDPIHASTGTEVFGNNLSGTDGEGDPLNELWHKRTADEFRLRADFDNLARYVAIDMIGNNSSDYGILEAYNSGGTIVASVSSGKLTDGNPWTAEISLASFDIAYVISSGISGHTIYLDNLRAVIPEPGTILLVGLGGLALVRKHRK